MAKWHIEWADGDDDTINAHSVQCTEGIYVFTDEEYDVIMAVRSDMCMYVCREGALGERKDAGT